VLGGDPPGLVSDHSRGDAHRIARGHRAARRERAHPPREAARVAAGYLDVGDIDAQLVGHHLRPHRRMRLSLAWDSSRRHHLARNEHLYVRALVRPDPGALDIDADAHSHVLACRPWTKHRDRPFEESGVVAAVVDDSVAVLPRDPDLVGKLVRLNEVAPTHLDSIKTKLRCDRVESSLHDKARMGTSGAAIR